MKKRNKFSRALYSVLETTSKTERIILALLASVMIVSTFVLLNKMIFAITKQQPIKGGTYSEGIIGTPKFINPVLATSQIDKDLSRLVYSGILRKTNFGTYEPDLGSCENIATKNVTCTLRDKLLFSDGKPLTAEDVVFTIELLKDLSGRNPQGSLWLGIELKVVDEKTVSFTLPQGYSGFQDLLTQGIIPGHIWQGQTQEDIETSLYNLEPIGSGPYKVSSLTRDNTRTKASMIILRRSDIITILRILKKLSLEPMKVLKNFLMLLKITRLMVDSFQNIAPFRVDYSVTSTHFLPLKCTRFL